MQPSVQAPHKSPQGQGFIDAHQKVIFGLFMAEGSSTIKNNLIELNRNMMKCRYIRDSTSYHSLYPHPVKDLLGTGPEVDMVTRSLDPGRSVRFSQFDMFMRSINEFSTFWNAYIKGVV